MIHKTNKLISEKDGYWLILQPDTSTFQGIRDFLLIRAMLNYGLRLYEVTQLKWQDIDWYNERLVVANSRGANSRMLELQKTDLEMLKEWYYARYEREDNSDSMDKVYDYYVFTTLLGKRLTARYICKILTIYGRKSLLNQNIKPSVLRNTFAVNFYNDFQDMRKLQLKLGHENIKTTKRYLQIYDPNIAMRPMKLNIISML
ncbi:tyrosine-type recombinase/integrase [Natranaerobius thermophilus]|uniref:Integrase family protein n=1 Tax=Natranaerobius thermophilus (strain ATCC BAA-1301 / DSM 18059 / JW/NM-WN-LF) TaxID=457570 RepID=B2A748_NATTJ|nr:tyrosine-type recombinase/integrase [Natranaerobius thermophilus]ACB85639.1 integrase family protein [Natranaerobius thermophilus JW/NM-WN-LF]